MAGPPPPPPPPLNASQPLSLFSSKGDSKDGRGLLLESIRKGTTLKKTVTNDKSAPVVAGSAGGRSSQNNTTANTRTVSTNNTKNNEAAAPQAGGLGGLFANGIPKLKATGLPIGKAYQQYRNENDGFKSKAPSVCNSSSNSSTNNKHVNSSSHGIGIRTRGPPPQPPGFPQNYNSSDTVAGDELPVHNRSSSVVSLNENSYQNRASDSGKHIVNHGKPTVAPKPHSIVNKLGNKQATNDNRPLVTRAQSMRVPRSTINITEAANGPQYPEYNQSELYRMSNRNNLPSFHQSQESLGKRSNRPASPTRNSLNATSWSSLNTANATLRPYNRSHGSPLRPPQSKPPPPPPTRIAMSPPMCPPPPPPTHVPPPPPHRVNPAPPPPPSVLQNRLNNNNINNSGAPPTPPVRNSSMRSSNNISSKALSFESRYIFRSADEFPPPPPYQNVIKIYNSKVQAKQQAPQPPLHLQQSINRMWPCENSSNC